MSTIIKSNDKFERTGICTLETREAYYFIVGNSHEVNQAEAEIRKHAEITWVFFPELPIQENAVAQTFEDVERAILAYFTDPKSHIFISNRKMHIINAIGTVLKNVQVSR
jgi:hypothetical protein